LSLLNTLAEVNLMADSEIHSDRIRILVADSTPMRSQLLSGALRRRPEFKVTACPMSSDAILKLVEAGLVHILVANTDHDDDLSRDFTILRRIHLTRPQIHKVLIVDSYDRQLTVSAFRSGVRGIFSFKDSKFRDLCKCIHVVQAGQVWANTTQLLYLLESVIPVPSLRVLSISCKHLLTPREEQVVALVADGMSNREVAIELGLREHTVKTYLFRIFEKLGISRRVELVLFAMNHGHNQPAEWMAGSA
jgi:DNA-binding NarL/FixJ family response regulator